MGRHRFVAGLLFALPAIAAEGEIWRQGAWTAVGPGDGKCAGQMLVQVKGPGSIFEPSNSAALASLEKALPAAVAAACPGVRDAVVASARTRRLIRLPAVPAAAEQTPAAAAPSSAPVREAGQTVTAPAPSPPEPPVAPVRRMTPVAPPAGAAPFAAPAGPLVEQSGLRSVASVSKIEDKCDAVLKWVESGVASAPRAGYYRGMRANTGLEIFRDGPMQAVFGTPYDRMDAKARQELYDDLFGRCSGAFQSNGFKRARDQRNAALQQYVNQMRPYQEVLNQAFQAQPGPMQPTAITKYVGEVRGQMDWGNRMMASVGNTGATTKGFATVEANLGAAEREMALLTKEERERVRAVLQRRLAEIAPPVVDEWYRQAGQKTKTVASARATAAEYRELNPVLQRLEPGDRREWAQKFSGLTGQMTRTALDEQLSALRSTPATLDGARQLGAWKTGFDREFQEFRGLETVGAAEAGYQAERRRLLTGALVEWRKQASAIPAEGPAIAAKRAELESLFSRRDDRQGSEYAQFELPLQEKEQQLRAKVEAEKRKQREDLIRAARGTSPAALEEALLDESSLPVKGLQNGTLLATFYRGDFSKIQFGREELAFSGVLGGYLRGYAEQCRDHLPANRVPIMEQYCTHVYVRSGGCAEYGWRESGLYADPAIYSVEREIQRMKASEGLRGAFAMMKQGVGGMMSTAGEALGISNDVRAVIEKSGCGSAALRRFAENVRRYGKNLPPVRLDGAEPASSVISPLPGMPFRDQDYGRLVEELVGEHSKTWVMNRYQHGSVRTPAVEERDELGRPAKLRANYAFQGMSGNQEGSVTVTFSEGAPQCLYFFDFPATCRSANRRVVNEYIGGKFEKK